MRYFIIIMLIISKISLFSANAPYVPQDFSYLIGIKGISENTLKLHFSLYEGYVKNTNLILEQLKTSEGYTYGALKLRLGWEMDGMLLHEGYFKNLGGKGKLDPTSTISKAIEQAFDSYTNWEKDFKATGLIRGIGWVILYKDPTSGRLFNMWIEDHNIGELVQGIPLLIMDVWEHAYLLDYGSDRKQYIDAFFDNINWKVVQSRYEEGKI